MGAGGSTAASCSSLDVSNEHHYKHLGRHHKAQQHKHIQELRKQQNLNRMQASGADICRGANMKQANSHFDLTTNHLLNSDTAHQLGRLHSPKTAKYGWFDTNESESYSLSNADIVSTRPIKVLPSQPVVSQVNLSGSKCKSNAGVAGRIQMQRQQQRAQELRKFSDSLPSLASIHPSQPMLNQTSSPPASSRLDDNYYQHYANHKQQKQRVCSQQINQISAKQQHHLMQQNHANNNQQRANIHLVNRNDDSAYPLGQSNVEHHAGGFNGSQQQLIKRAISLSSLHNLHHHHHLHPHNHHQQKQQQVTHIERANSGGKCKKQQPVSAKHNHVSSSSSNRGIPESMNNYLSYDLQQPCSKHHGSSPHNHSHNDGHQPKSKQNYQQQANYNQPTPLAKKILKLKHYAKGNGSSTKRYQQQQQQQQGCPVLPPLPRSQSLHELIQLRATENGQRMRTTGTLRGPLGANGEQPCSKVNLVAELLESRRQQKLSEEFGDDAILASNDAQSSQNLATMLSQASSSSDDGIHDVSISGDQSTGSSRQHKFTTDNNPISHHNNHRLSLTSEISEQNKQRVFRKNHQLSSNNNNPKRYSQNANRQTQENEKDFHRSTFNEASKRADYDQRFDGKSTLKRSVSHSALQTNNNNNNLEDERYEDENDDLNELAKFLYQFKQRQAAASASKISAKDESNNAAHRSHNGQSSNATVSTGSNSQANVNTNFQQSPNSTTSSSGFASSTCTSNSTSSSASSKENNHVLINNSSLTKTTEQEFANEKPRPIKLPGRKKYPAPPIPDELSNKLTKDSPKPVNNNKCLISGKLKLSSSLLSIVDEYNSTQQSSSSSKHHHSPASANITSVLLSASKPTQTYLDAEPDADFSGPSSSCSNECHQLEELKKYTKLRQMSQSQLALNHLTSSSASPMLTVSSRDNNSSAMAKDKRESASGSGSKPYKSKLIDLIRRVSDKSEVANHKSAVVSPPGTPTTTSGRSNNGSVGGRFESGNNPKTINQGELATPYLKQVGGRQGDYDHKVCDDEARLRKRDAPLYAEIPGRPGRGAGCLSESLCDLNFDCDFELIKNCGSANEPKGLMARQKQQRQQQPPTQPQAAKQQQAQCGSILTSQGLVDSQTPLTPSAVASADDCQARRRQKELAKKHHHQQQQQQQQQQQELVINSSKGENNWRLGPSSLSLTKPVIQVATTSDKASKKAASGKQLNQSLEESSKKASSREAVCKLHSAAANIDKLASQQQQQQQQRKQPVKLKWSATGWLMNGSGSKTKKQAAAAEKATAGKNGMSKSISNSRIPSLTAARSKSSSNQSNHDEVTDITNAVGPVLDENTSSAKQLGNFANVNNDDANQLLCELDHSLDLVSANCAPFSRKSALSWWKSDNQMSFHEDGPESSLRDGTGMNLFSEEDDYDDEDDYASLNRAMINATFDADIIIQQHERQQLQESNHKTNTSSVLPSMEAGSPSDSFTFSAPSSPAVERKSPCVSNSGAKQQAVISAQDHPQSDSNGGVDHSNLRKLHEHRNLGISKQLGISQRGPASVEGQQGSNVRENELELKGLSQIRKFMCNSNHVISNLSTTSAVSVSQPSDSSGFDGAAAAASKHQASPASKRVGCNLASKRIVSCASEQQVVYENDGERLRAEDGKMIVDGQLGSVPIVAAAAAASDADDAARCIHELNNKQQLQHNHLSNARCSAISESVDCAHGREVGTNNIPSNELVHQRAKLPVGLERTLADGPNNCNNNLDCRCCSALDSGRPSMGDHLMVVAGDQKQSAAALRTASVPTAPVGQSNVPRRFSGKTNGLVLSKCQSSSQASGRGDLLNFIDPAGQGNKRQQVANGCAGEQGHCHRAINDSTACCIHSCQNKPQAGVGVKSESLKEHKPILLMSSEMTKTPTKASGNLQQLNASATNSANGSFCSIQGQPDELGQSTCACCHSGNQMPAIQRCKKSVGIEEEVKNRDKNMNGHQQAMHCGHSLMATSSAPVMEELNSGGRCFSGMVSNNGRQTVMVEDNPAATELEACNCGILESSNKCCLIAGAQNGPGEEFFMCPNLHVNGSETYCRSKRTSNAATASTNGFIDPTNGLADESESNKLINQHRAFSCRCYDESISAAASSNPDEDHKSDNIIKGQLAAVAFGPNASSFQQLTPPSGPSKLQNSVIADSGEGGGLVESGRSNNRKSSSLLPHPIQECSQLDKNASRSGASQESIKCSTSCNEQHYHQQQPFLTSNCSQCCSKNAICNQNEQATAVISPRCKVAACHYPSSKLSQTNYGEDVKCGQACLGEDNSISKAGQKLENAPSSSSSSGDESGYKAGSAAEAGETSTNKGSVNAAVSVSAAEGSSAVAPTNSCCSQANKISHGDCRCNNRRRASASQQPSLEKDGKLIKRFNAAMARFTAHPVYCIGQQQSDCNRQLNNVTKVVSVSSSKQQKPPVIANNPICRSNSELTSNTQSIKYNRKLAPQQALCPSNGHNHQRQKQQRQQEQPQQSKEQPLFSKLRGSLLNRKQEAPSSQLNSKGSKLSSSQLSLFSYCNEAHFISPFIGQLDLNLTSNSKLNSDFDDNFILKRKTPNAGLKTRC